MIKKNQFAVIIFIISLLSSAIAGCSGGKSRLSGTESEQASSSAGNKVNLSEEEAVKLLTTVLGDKLKEGMGLISSGEEEINGQLCRKFALGANTDAKFTAEEHFAVTGTGKIYKLDISRNEYILYGPESEHQMPFLGIDIQGMEEVNPTTDYLLDDVLYVKLESYYSFINDKDYNEKSMLARIKELEGDEIKLKSITYSEEPNKDYSGGLGYPIWSIIYENGKNEDKVYCSDVYFRTPFGEYRVHTIVPVDRTKEYSNKIKQRLASAILLPPLTMDTSGTEADNASGTEYRNETLYIRLQSFATPIDGKGHPISFDENNLPAQIKKLQGNDIRAVKVTKSEEHSSRLSMQAYLIAYETGENEDTSYCTDLYFQSDSGDFRVHISVPADKAKEYDNEIKRRLATVSYDTYYTDMRYQ